MFNHICKFCYCLLLIFVCASYQYCHAEAKVALAETNELSEAKRREILNYISEKAKMLWRFHADHTNWTEVTEDYRYAIVPLALFP
jgi:hypothetical protein